eukprot:8535374-Pyramimonas_sp.AAC.1
MLTKTGAPSGAAGAWRLGPMRRLVSSLLWGAQPKAPRVALRCAHQHPVGAPNTRFVAPWGVPPSALMRVGS